MSAVSGTKALPRSTDGNLRNVLANLTLPRILRNSEMPNCVDVCVSRQVGRCRSAIYTWHVQEPLMKETLNIVKESHRARLEGITRHYRELKLEAVRAVRRKKEAQVCGVCETVQSNLWSTDSRPSCRGILTLQP